MSAEELTEKVKDKDSQSFIDLLNQHNIPSKEDILKVLPTGKAVRIPNWDAISVEGYIAVECLYDEGMITYRERNDGITIWKEPPQFRSDTVVLGCDCGPECTGKQNPDSCNCYEV